LKVVDGFSRTGRGFCDGAKRVADAARPRTGGELPLVDDTLFVAAIPAVLYDAKVDVI
jgi:hypothetical protein